MSSCRQLFRPYDHLTRSLRSSPITNLHRSYGSVRPSALHRYSRLAVFRSDVLLSPVVSTIRPPDPIPSLQSHYEPSSLIRIGPPQCSASVLSPRGFQI